MMIACLSNSQDDDSMPMCLSILAVSNSQDDDSMPIACLSKSQDDDSMSNIEYVAVYVSVELTR